MNRFGWFVVFIGVVFLALASFAPAAQAAGSASIVGTVQTSSGDVISAAKVELLGSLATLTTTSAKNGHFQFLSLTPGTYVLRTSKQGYETTDSNPLALQDGQALELSVILQAVSTTNISTLGRVSVTGHPTLNTSSAASTTITNNQFLAQGATQVQYGLENLPGITLERYDNGAPGAVTTFTIRGAGGFGGGSDGTSNTGYEILVLQDGEPLRNGQFGDFDASSLTPAIYSRVEVIKGVGGTSLFGANTIGGTINLVTRDPLKTEGGEIIQAFGGYGTTDWNISETNTVGKIGYLVDFHRFGSDGFVPSPYVVSYQSFAGPVVAQPTQRINLKTGLVKLRYDFSGVSSLVLGASLESDWRDQLGLIGNPNLNPDGSPQIDPTNGLPSFFGFPGDFVWNIQPKYSADFHTDLGGGTLILRSYAQQLERVVDGFGEPPAICCFATRSLDRLTGDSITWEKALGNNTLTLSAGANGDNFYFGNNPNFAFAPFSKFIPTATGIQIERTYLVRDEINTGKVDYTLAGYYSDYDTLKVKRFDPRLAVVYKPDQNSVLKGSIGTGFAPPRLSDLFGPTPDLNARDNFNGPTCSFCVAPSANPSLKSETAVGFDLGYQRIFGERGDAMITLYRYNLTDHIFNGLFPAPAGLFFSDGTPVVFISKPINLAKSVYQGLEFEGNAPISVNFGVHATYNIQSAYPDGVDPLTQQELGNVVNRQQYLGVPIHKYGWDINYRNNSRATAFFGGNYFAKNNAYNQPPFWVYNAGMTLPLGVDRLHVAWNNIFNTNGGLWPAFQHGVPIIGAPGYNLGCLSSNPGIFCTTAYNAPPHMLTVSFDHRWGSLRQQ